uniref:Uncharacterized protein n=1 Tax=Rhizophora mucronata TaxID=61149 RepID=A0A2P2NM72_RHIMU
MKPLFLASFSVSISELSSVWAFISSTANIPLFLGF